MFLDSMWTCCIRRLWNTELIFQKLNSAFNLNSSELFLLISFSRKVLFEIFYTFLSKILYFFTINPSWRRRRLSRWYSVSSDI